jgi:uncharacterized UBP type Zn finger protein
VVNASVSVLIGGLKVCWNILAGMVTHKGASADSGHYIGFARADVVNSGSEANFDEDHDQWIKFDDDKVRKKKTRS